MRWVGGPTHMSTVVYAKKNKKILEKNFRKKIKKISKNKILEKIFVQVLNSKVKIKRIKVDFLINNKKSGVKIFIKI